MSEKQLDALKRGRELCVARLKEQGKVTNEKKAVSKDIMKIKQEKNIKDVEELKKITEINNVNDNVEKLNGRFNDLDSKLNELINLKKQKKFLKEDDIIKNEIRNEIKKGVVNDNIVKKMEKYNPFLGKL